MNYDNTNRGALFKNNKQGNEKRPDYTGSLNVGGVDYQLSAWIKASKAGDKYMSLSVQPKRDTDRIPERKDADDLDGLAMHGKQSAPDFNDDIPF